MLQLLMAFTTAKMYAQSIDVYLLPLHVHKLLLLLHCYLSVL